MFLRPPSQNPSCTNKKENPIAGSTKPDPDPGSAPRSLLLWLTWLLLYCTIASSMTPTNVDNVYIPFQSASLFYCRGSFNVVNRRQFSEPPTRTAMMRKQAAKRVMRPTWPMVIALLASYLVLRCNPFTATVNIGYSITALVSDTLS
jgi:hypothetical protein